MTKSKYRRKNETISGRLHNELVMMDVSKGKYFSLNPVATQIWDLLEQPLSLDEICGNLIEEYKVDKIRCHKEVEAYLMEMENLGLIGTA